MIATINRTRLISTFKYNPRQLPSGMINGKKWSLFKKQRISDELYKYVFMITEYNNRGGSTSMARTVITGDEDVRYVAEIALVDREEWER